MSTHTQANEKVANQKSASTQGDSQLCPSEDLLDYARAYARENPEVVALWALGIGFVLGWKLKPW